MKDWVTGAFEVVDVRYPNGIENPKFEYDDLED